MKYVVSSTPVVMWRSDHS